MGVDLRIQLENEDVGCGGMMRVSVKGHAEEDKAM
jgi:hypothetical protein